MRSSSPGLSAAVCGLSRTFSSSHSGLSRAGGSQEATSSAGPAQLPAGQGAQQRRLVDDLAAPDVDHDRATAQAPQRLGVDEPAGSVGQRQRHGP